MMHAGGRLHSYVSTLKKFQPRTLTRKVFCCYAAYTEFHRGPSWKNFFSNLALGENRADTVRAQLERLGISPSRIRTISYGKEKPFCTDETEAC
jgi:hypothetical protein